MPKKVMTLDKLARMVRRGFGASASKKELADLARTTHAEIEILARTTHGEIENLAHTTHEEIENLARITHEEFFNVNKTLGVLADSQDLIRSDIHDIKLTLGPLVSHTVAMERDMLELKKRMDRVERKVGLAK